MKKEIILAVFLFGSDYIKGQSIIDHQWLILDNHGKIGTDQFDENYYPPNNTIPGAKFLLDSVGPVDWLRDVRARNDIFIIYEDGHHYNSHISENISQTIEDIFTPIPRDNGQMTHYFQSEYTRLSGKKIQSLYLTNSYESDDPPKPVKSMAWLGSDNQIEYTVANTTPDSLLSANHNAALNKDITLIIKNNGVLRNGDTLSFNKIKVADSISVNGNTFFSVSKVFNSNVNFSTIPLTYLSNNSVIFDSMTVGVPPYIYINLHVEHNIQNTVGSLDSALLKTEAIFELKHHGGITPYASLSESVRTSHDPNNVMVEKICSSSDPDYVQYKINFENTGTITAKDINIRFSLRDVFDPGTISILEAVIGGRRMSSILPTINGQDIMISYPRHEALVPCNDVDQYSCNGWIKFCVRLKEERSLTSLSTKLELEDPNVFFAGHPFPLLEFKDLLRKKRGVKEESSRPYPEKNCTCVPGDKSK